MSEAEPPSTEAVEPRGASKPAPPAPPALPGPQATRLRRAVVLTLVLAGAGLLLDARVALRGDLEPASAEAMRALASTIREVRQPGDVLVHSPLFSVRELAAFGDLPIRPDLPAEEVRLNRRVLVADRSDWPMHGFAEAKVQAEFGDVLALRVQAPRGGGALVHFDFRDELDRVRVLVEQPIGTVISECNQPRAEGGVECPGQPDWIYAAVRSLRVDGGPARCIWAHPTKRGALVFELPATPAPPTGKRLALEVRTALDDSAVTGTKDGAPVETEIVQAGRTLATITAKNEIGWFELTEPIEAGAPVRLEVTTSNDGRRHHCIQARIIEAEAK